ncbi:MAG: hypothetical protein ACOVOJ_06675 [Pirellula sp.]|jgi:hypothetical protein
MKKHHLQRPNPQRPLSKFLRQTPPANRIRDEKFHPLDMKPKNPSRQTEEVQDALLEGDEVIAKRKTLKSKFNRSDNPESPVRIAIGQTYNLTRSDPAMIPKHLSARARIRGEKIAGMKIAEIMIGMMIAGKGGPVKIVKNHQP